MRIVLEGTSWLDEYPIEKLQETLQKWSFWARPDQLAPEHDWTTWLVLGGRGAGKTRTGAEWIKEKVARGARHIALIGETYEDAREVMICGPSGLLAVSEDTDLPQYEPSRHRIVWPNGAIGHVFSADDPEGLRGFQHDTAWSDEICKWQRAEAAWDNLQLGLRLGDRPQQIVTTTPRQSALLKKIMNRDDTAMSRSSTYENRGHLADAFLTQITSTYEGTTLGAQELLGEIIEDQEGALWSWRMIRDAQMDCCPSLDRIVVAIDPPVTSGPKADACGIIIAGVYNEGSVKRAVVIDDGTVRGASPAVWAEKAIAKFHEFRADRMVVEVNQGGELVTQILAAIDETVPLKPVHAQRGKIVRAEPVAALYEKRRVHHLRGLSDLEAEMTSFTGEKGQNSPDRLDALVWALTELLLNGGTPTPGVRAI